MESMSHSQRQFKCHRCFSGCPHPPLNPWFQSTEYSSPTTPLALKASPCLQSAEDLPGSRQAEREWGAGSSPALTCASPSHQLQPGSSHSQNQAASRHHAPVKSIVKVGEKNAGAEARDGETVPAATETMRRSSCSSGGTSEVNWVTPSACPLICSPCAGWPIWKESCSSSLFHCPVLLSPAPCLPLHPYSHSYSIPLLLAKGHGNLPSWGFFFSLLSCFNINPQLL